MIKSVTARQRDTRTLASGWTAIHTAATTFAVLVAACVGFGLKIGLKWDSFATRADTGALEVRATKTEERQAATDRALDSFRSEQRAVNSEVLRYLLDIKRGVETRK
jgi:hypothetical protein